MARLLSVGTPIAAELRAQYAVASVARRELTGVGFFTHFAVPASAPRVAALNAEMGADATLTNGIGVGFVLFIRDGMLSMLEGFTYGERWPADARIQEWEEAPDE